MTELPDFLKPYQKKAKTWLKGNPVTDIEFSEVTYQILVKDLDKKKNVWTFIQFDQNDKLKDCFCSCDDNSEEYETQHRGCIHLAVAWYSIHDEKGVPVHKRFQESLWRKLGKIFCDRIGPDPSELKKIENGHYQYHSASGKQIFELKAKNRQAAAVFDKMLFDRPPATEETSIKFSNLSHEELQQWRIGQPSAELTFELSYWSDLAKWMFFQQEKKNQYQITMDAEEKHLPHRLRASFEEVSVEFYLSEANLPLIIPSLQTVNTPLHVMDNRLEDITSISYHKENATLRIHSKHTHKEQEAELSTEWEKNAIDAGEGWRYIPSQGFVASDPHHLLEHPVLKGNEIGELLSQQTALVKGLLENYPIHTDRVTLSYKLEFDSSWALHIKGYLFEVGDLTQKYSAIFGSWAYIESSGFHPIEGVKFDKPEFIVPHSEMSTFIQLNRSWLNQFPGFQVHLSSVEESLVYSVDKEGRLSFANSEEQRKAFGLQHDFNNFLYIQGHGFYPKSWSDNSRPLRAGIVIGKEQVPLFIKMQKEELQLISGFFANESPLTSIGLSIKVIQQGIQASVRVSPLYLIQEQFANKAVRFYDNYIYVPDEGFFEIPYVQRLPDAFRNEVVLTGEELDLFLTYQLQELLPRALEVDPRLSRAHHLHLEAADIKQDEKHHFNTAFNFVSEIGSVPALEVWEALQRKQNFLITSAGLLDLSEDRYNWLRALRKNRFDQEGKLSLSSLELIRLNAFDEVTSPKISQATTFQQIIEKLTDPHSIEPPKLQHLKSQLRPYQQFGVHWLWFLFQNGLSGLLCDDMGLGKTHQSMALIDAMHQQNPLGTCLIICPTSVLFHWQEKLHKFLPGIKVHTFYGNTRSLSHFHHSKGILLTSYGIARNEIEQLSTIPFDIVIMDEIQVAKNHQSRVHHALASLQARMRLGLSGTPIENHLRELKSLFDITLPAYLPSETDFREFFSKPIEKEGNLTRKLLLTRLIKPFVLRRKKEEVLLELPPKTEEVSHCALLNNQRILYNEVLTQQKQKLIGELEDANEPIPYVHIFSILSSLKQICNHPAAFLKEPEKYKEYQSGKWDLFIELLNEARQSGQKVVVFSHYLAMLDIMELYLKEQGIHYATIRGSTRNRAEEVGRFQNDPTCEVFLGSLQAAGAGIDLTAASVVIHYDRWWNAAKEDQATDRVHRIGQSRGVQVFKLVTLDTFEQRIDKMITEKGRLMEEVVTTDDHQILKNFDRRELLDLLKTVEVGKGVAAIETVDDL